MNNLSSGGADGVSTSLIFFALVFGFVTLPCQFVCKAVNPDFGKHRYYPGCPNTDSSYICELQGYEWDGTYKEDRGIEPP